MLQFFLVLVLLTTRWSVNFGHVAGPVYRAVINPSPPGWGICEAEDKNRCVLDSCAHGEPGPHNSEHSYDE